MVLVLAARILQHWRLYEHVFIHHYGVVERDATVEELFRGFQRLEMLKICLLTNIGLVIIIVFQFIV